MENGWSTLLWILESIFMGIVMEKCELTLSPFSNGEYEYMVPLEIWIKFKYNMTRRRIN
jgi:hypothetical protein